MRPSLIAVGRVRAKQMAEMPLPEHDNMVQAIASDRTDRPFTISILPRRSRCGWPIPNAHRPKGADEDRDYEGTSSTLGTAVAFPSPYTLQRWFARHRCRA